MLKDAIIDAAFGGHANIWDRVIKNNGNPDNSVEIDSSSPYGKGTLCYDYSNDQVYYKTDTDSTDWTLID